MHAVEALKQQLAKIRSGPPGSRRAGETVFMMKLTKKDSKGHKKLDPNSAEFQDYLSRYEETCVMSLGGKNGQLHSEVSMHTTLPHTHI